MKNESKKNSNHEPKSLFPKPLLLTFTFTLILMIIAIIFLFDDIQLIIACSLIIGGMILFIFLYDYSREKSRFKIGNNSIKIKISERISLKILWSNFDIVEVIRMKDLNPNTDLWGELYNIIFKKMDIVDNYRIWTDVEFSKKSGKN
ncbi:MAG: hypothetical protein ACFE92_17920 [Promethearchaeota archaeon]